VNKLEVVQPPNKEVIKSKELNKKGNYFFIIPDKETMDNKVYTINFLVMEGLCFKNGSGCVSCRSELSYGTKGAGNSRRKIIEKYRN